MLRRGLKRKGLAKVLALVLAVSLAMPGTALAAATQSSTDEAAVEAVYEEAAEEIAEADETDEETPELTEEGAESEDPEEEAPADAEEQEAVEGSEDEEDPADAGTTEEAAAAEEVDPADTGTTEDPAVAGDTEDPAAEEEPEEPADTGDTAEVAEDEESPADSEEDSAPEGETAAEETPDIEMEIPTVGITDAPEALEDSAAAAAAVENSYTVKFDPNSGTWYSSYYKSEYENGYKVSKGSSMYLPGSYAVERSGYKMIGWTTTKNGTPVLTGDYTPTKNITLYAKWAKLYKVTFNAGEGYFGSNTSQKTKVIQIESGKDIGYNLSYSSNTPRNGSKAFLGWYKDSALKTPAKRSDTITKDTTYYAKYEAKVYKITVTGLKGASYQNRATGEYVSERDSTAASYSFYIRQGDEIGYLYADKDDEDARFFFDQDCKTKPYYSSFVPTGNLTVYAKFNSEVTITWDAAGGKDYNDKSTGTVSCKKNLMCENLPTSLTKAGYYFVGWYDKADSSKKTLPASHVFKANTTVVAKWATGIKITFKANGGTFSGGRDTEVIYIKAKSAINESFSVRKDGYALTGWKNSVTGKTVTSIYNEKPAKATTYTAVWTKQTTAETVNVTIMAGEGSIYDWNSDKYVTKLVVKAVKNSTLGDLDLYIDLMHDEPYKGLDVVGWSLSKGGSALSSSYKITKAVTLYPLWAKRTSPKVVLVTNGGAIDKRPDNDPRIIYAQKDSTIKLPDASNIEKEGFTFLGWYTDPAFKTKVSNPDAFKVTKSCYLYAKWKQGAPSTLGKTARGDMFNLANNVKVTWQAVPGAKYYKVYRQGITSSGETQKDPVIVTTGLVGWDSSPGLTNGHAYRYKIVASTTGKGDSSGDSTLSYSKVMYRLKTVVIRSVKNTAAGEVTVTYDKTTSGDSYVLQYCTREDMVGAKTKVVLGASNTSYKIGGLQKGKTYYISIRVRKKVDGIDYYTTFGVPKKITITK